MSRKLRQDLHTLAGAYALDALPEEELRRFEDHLLYCEACVQEVRGLSETAALLGAAAAQTPPEGMRRSVLAEVARTRQLAPAPQRPTPVMRIRWWQKGAWYALAACLALILALGWVAWDQSQQVNQLRSKQQQIASVLAAPDAEYTSAQPQPGVSVTAVTSENLGGLVFTVQGLPSLEDQDYQLWMAAPDGSVRSAGVLNVTPDGQFQPLLADDLADAQALAMTIEPPGGSPQPTSDPMMSIPLEA